MDTLAGRAARQVEVLADLSRQIVLDASFGDGIHGSAEIATVSRMREDFEQANQEFLRAPEPFASVVDASFDHDLVESFSANMDAALAGQQISFDAMLDSLYAPPEEGFMGLRDALTTGLNARADELNADASGRERLYIGLAVATLGAAITLTWLVSWSITRPLRSLTRQATDMAERRLPDAVNQILDTPPGEDVSVPQVTPVAVHTDEVADVAAANTVQDTALDLAIEQAVLRRNIADSFVNLGRRNQNLLGRQLDFITELESNETDPRTLADLFRLDHLATRMRRNAESLLVLAASTHPGSGRRPCASATSSAPPSARSRTTTGACDIEPATIVGRRRPGPPRGRARGERPGVSPPDQTVDIPAPAAPRRAVRGRAPPWSTPASASRRTQGLQPPPGGDRELHHRPVQVPRPLRGREPGRPPRHPRRAPTAPGNGITATIVLPADLLTSEPVTTAPVTPPHGQRRAPVARRPGPPPGSPGGRRQGRPRPASRPRVAGQRAPGDLAHHAGAHARAAAASAAAGPPPAPPPAPPADRRPPRPPRRPPRSPVDRRRACRLAPPLRPRQWPARRARTARGRRAAPVPPRRGPGRRRPARPPGRSPAMPAGRTARRRAVEPARRVPSCRTDVVRHVRPRRGRAPAVRGRLHGGHRRPRPADHLHRRCPARPEETRQRRAEATAAGNGRHGVE